jgi:hypothetical protein
MQHLHNYQVWGMTPKRTRQKMFGGINDAELKNNLNISNLNIAQTLPTIG